MQAWTWISSLKAEIDGLNIPAFSQVFFHFLSTLGIYQVQENISLSVFFRFMIVSLIPAQGKYFLTDFFDVRKKKSNECCL